jgi:hypothetical protein
MKYAWIFDCSDTRTNQFTHEVHLYDANDKLIYDGVFITRNQYLQIVANGNGNEVLECERQDSGLNMYKIALTKK